MDLNTEMEYVQTRIADYWTNLLSFGFSGMRVDAAKHMAPDDLVAMIAVLRNNMGGALPADFHMWQEVLTGGEGDMLVANNASGYNYGGYMEQALLAAGLSEDEMLSIRLWADYYPKQPTLDGGNVDMRRKAIQNDDADQQTSGSTSRDMGNAGCVLTVSCPDAATHRGFEVTLFTVSQESQVTSHESRANPVLLYYSACCALPTGRYCCAFAPIRLVTDCRVHVRCRHAYFTTFASPPIYLSSSYSAEPSRQQ